MGLLASEGLCSMILFRYGNPEDNLEIVAGTNQNIQRCDVAVSCVVILYVAQEIFLRIL